jgi:hypothetical protein
MCLDLSAEVAMLMPKQVHAFPCFLKSWNAVCVELTEAAQCSQTAYLQELYLLAFDRLKVVLSPATQRTSYILWWARARSFLGLKRQ